MIDSPENDMRAEVRLTDNAGSNGKNVESSFAPLVTSTMPDITPRAISAGAPINSNNFEGMYDNISKIFRSMSISEKQ